MEKNPKDAEDAEDAEVGGDPHHRILSDAVISASETSFKLSGQNIGNS